MTDHTLDLRRAKFVYEAARLAAIAAGAPIVPSSLVDREPDFRTQFVEAIAKQCGPDRSESPEQLHENWMRAYIANEWVYGVKYDRARRTHPDLVPYKQLGKLERDKDEVFLKLCEIARLYID